MSQEERYGTRGREYSSWHRRNSTKRFVGIEKAQLLGMIDLDASLYVEYDDGDKVPLALVETAQDVGQSYKCATVTDNLAKRASMPAYVLLYTLSQETNPADNECQDIEAFRVKRLYPIYDSEWKTLTPQQWAEHLVRMRQEQTKVLDAKCALLVELRRDIEGMQLAYEHGHNEGVLEIVPSLIETLPTLLKMLD